jgi:hypothetical protein
MSDVDDLNSAAGGVLKKIRASAGALQGNFYFVGKADGSQGALCLTLAARDKSGSIAKANGKKLRSEIKGAKFSIGRLIVDNGQLTFVLHGGSASKAHMTKCFKKTLSQVDGLRHLLKAVIRKEGDSVGEAVDEEESKVVEDETLDAAELAELAALEKEQAGIADLSAELQGFLSQETELAEFNDQLREEIENLERLTKGGDASPDEIHAARVALSEVMDVGQSIDIAEGSALPVAVMALLSLTSDKVYADHLRMCKPIIDEAIGDAVDLGGAKVKALFDDAKSLAESEDFQQALSHLNNAYLQAQQVMARLPFAQAFRSHRPTIEAATNIAEFVSERTALFPGSTASVKAEDDDSKTTYGSEVEREWKKVKALNQNQQWGEAKALLDQIIQYLKTIKPLLKFKIDANHARAETSQGSMNRHLTGLQDASTEERAKAMALLRDAVSEELACSAEAKDLGLDPAIEMNQPYSAEEDSRQALTNNRPTCREKFIAMDWFSIKEQFHTYAEKKSAYDAAAESQTENAEDLQRNLVDRGFMTQLWKYRQQYVERLINSLRKDHPNLIAKASGSTDLESDIDITFVTSASKEDVIAARRFNAHILDEFGKPPGRTFDVNIYIREYGDGNKESFNEFHSLEPNVDFNLPESTNDQTKKLTQVDMDVATLLKQRRFLPQDQFDDLLGDVLDGMAEAQRKKVLHKYEEGEGIYFSTLRDKLDGIESRLKGILVDNDASDPRKAKATSALELISSLRAVEDIRKFQRGLQTAVEALEIDFPDLTMEATDEMYLDRMGVVRDNEDLFRRLSADEAEARERYERENPIVTDKNGKEEPRVPFEEWRKRKLEVLQIQIKKDIITNIIFANEAYVSEGAISHVVQTGQARDKTDEQKQKMLREMPIANLVQSTNEQLADFFKDMAHSTASVRSLRDDEGNEQEARRQEGEAYVHASKYVIRMLGAAYALALKYEAPGSNGPLALGWFSTEVDIASLEGVIADSSLSDKFKALEKRVDKLLYKLRKSGTIPQPVKGEVAVDEIKIVFKADTIEAFTAKFRKLGVQLNNAVRQQQDFIEEQRVHDDTIDDYMTMREETVQEKGETILNQCSLKPLTDRKASMEKGLKDVGIAEDQAALISQKWSAIIAGIKAYSAYGDEAEVNGLFDEWQAMIGSIHKQAAKVPLTNVLHAVRYRFDMKTLQLRTEDRGLNKLISEVNEERGRADNLIFKQIPQALKTWVPLTPSQNRVQVARKRAAEKELLLTYCATIEPSLRSLLKRLQKAKPDIAGVVSIERVLDDKIAIMQGRKKRVHEFRVTVLNHALIPS